MSAVIVTIYHGTGEHHYAGTWQPDYPIAAVYRYSIPFALLSSLGPVNDPPRLLVDIWRDNNAVDGWEICVKAQCRSLSVGDVVLLDGMTGLGEAWAVTSAGWESVPVEALPAAPDEIPRYLWMGRKAQLLPA